MSSRGPLVTFPPRTSYDVDDAAALPGRIELVGGVLSLGTDLTVDAALDAYPESPTVELVEGNLIVNPAPHPRHADAAHATARWLEERVDADQWKVRESVNVRLDDRDLLIPDVLVYRATAMSDAAWIRADAVALAVEVLSPGELAWRKPGMYLAAGVAAVWSVDLDAHTIHAEGSYPFGDPAELDEVLWPR